MKDVFELLSFVKPYWKKSVVALILLTTLVVLDLSIPRLIQRIIDQGIEQQNQGAYLALDPETSQEILSAVRYEINQLPPSARRPVILTSQDIRRFVRKLIELEFFEVAVMSFQELSADCKVQPIGRISLQHQSEQDEDDMFDEQLESPFALVPAMP